MPPAEPLGHEISVAPFGRQVEQFLEAAAMLRVLAIRKVHAVIVAAPLRVSSRRGGAANTWLGGLTSNLRFFRR